MDKRPTLKETKRKEIVNAALELFFEKGYDGTSVRMIQNRVGNQVGLFYYYFNSKDDVFSAVIDLFFEPYERQMREITDKGRENPDHVLTAFLGYINDSTKEFRKQYLQKLHWSILAAIREHTLLVMKKYIREILDIYLEKGIIKNAENTDVAVNLLAFGIGGSILYQTEEEYDRQQPAAKKLLAQILGLAEEL